MRKILPLLLMSAAIAGCATTNMNTNEPAPPMPISPAKTTLAEATGPVTVLVTPEINDLMDTHDRAKLQHLVAMGTAHQKVSWNSTKSNNQFTFTSTDIFVNSEGNACRHYNVSVDVSAFLHHIDKQADMTACRNDDGAWMLKK